MSGRILIVDDVATNRIVYRARLAAGLYDPVLAADGQGCLDVALAVPPALRPDLILLSMTLPDMPGEEVLRRLRADPIGRFIPVIAMAPAGNPAARLAALGAGADAVIVTPAAEGLLLARVRNLLRSLADVTGKAALTETGFAEAATGFDLPGTLAIVAAQSGRSAVSGLGPGHATAASTSIWEGLSRHLDDRVILVARTQDLAQAEGTAAMADVFIVQADDAGSPGALRLLSELKSHHATRHAAICLLDGSGLSDAAVMAFDLGADDVVGPDVSLGELALRLRGLLRRKRAADRRRSRLENNLRLAMVDPLTGLFNRRYAAPQLASIAARAAETGQNYAVMVVDIDRFKLVNDQHGHATGDEVLVEVARRLGLNLRERDLLARIGGEEFLVVLPDSNREDAGRVAERLCSAIEERPIRMPSGVRLAVTVSIGVAVAQGLPPSDAVVQEADLALLEAKGLGRNRVTFRLTAA